MKVFNITITNTSQPVDGGEGTIIYKGRSVRMGELVDTITTTWDNSTGAYVARTDAATLQYGTYRIDEIASPGGNHTDGFSREFAIRNQGQVTSFSDSQGNYARNYNSVWRGGLVVGKGDTQIGYEAHSDTTLEGVQYDVYTRSAAGIMTDGAKYVKPGELVTTITTSWDKTLNQYVACTSENALLYGTYEVIETKASAGYHKDGYKQTFQIRSSGQIVTFTDNDTRNLDTAYRGGVVISKNDLESGLGKPQAAANFGNITFNIENASTAADGGSRGRVVVDGHTYAPGEFVVRITTNADGYASTAADTLPHGTYTMREESVPSDSGYKINRDWSWTFQIREEGVIIGRQDSAKPVESGTQGAAIVANQVFRNDIK